MSRFGYWLSTIVVLLTCSNNVVAADDIRAHFTDWPPTTMPGALVTSAIFGFIGIVLAIIGFKIFDWLTPGDMQKEIFDNKNMAAAILGAAVILGLCHIIAAAVH